MNKEMVNRKGQDFSRISLNIKMKTEKIETTNSKNTAIKVYCNKCSNSSLIGPGAKIPKCCGEYMKERK